MFNSTTGPEVFPSGLQAALTAWLTCGSLRLLLTAQTLAQRSAYIPAPISRPSARNPTPGKSSVLFNNGTPAEDAVYVLLTSSTSFWGVLARSDFSQLEHIVAPPNLLLALNKKDGRNFYKNDEDY